ncbi:MAG: hypothetical protein ACTSYL_06625 [Candidatus Thorarchaeota archaeon]
MKPETSVYIPPVSLESLEDFRRYARAAALVTYTPEYFRGPFIDDHKRLRRVTLVAVGVLVRGMPLTFKYTLDYNDLYDPSRGWEEQTTEIDLLLSQLISSLESETPVVRGTVETEAPLGEVLSVRP